MMIEQDIYNKRIVELMKKKTALIEALGKLMEIAHKPETNPKEEPARLTASNALLEACGNN